MSSFGISSIGVNPYNYVNSTKDKHSINQTDSFGKKVEEVVNNKIYQNSIGTKSQNGMVVSQPPNYGNYANDNIISNKSKSDMTMDEYKQYFSDKMSKIPVSSYYRASYNGSLVITEKAFEKMKSDPEYEKTVLNMLKEMYSVNGLPQRSYCMQVIGASPEECYGYSVPMDNGKNVLGTSGSDESWWQKRHQKMEKLMKEESKNRVARQRQQKEAYSKHINLNNYDMQQFMILNSMKNNIMFGQVLSQPNSDDFSSTVSKIL